MGLLDVFINQMTLAIYPLLGIIVLVAISPTLPVLAIGIPTLVIISGVLFFSAIKG